jgi:hypothetical protein
MPEPYGEATQWCVSATLKSAQSKSTSDYLNSITSLSVLFGLGASISFSKRDSLAVGLEKVQGLK